MRTLAALILVAATLSVSAQTYDNSVIVTGYGNAELSGSAGVPLQWQTLAEGTALLPVRMVSTNNRSNTLYATWVAIRQAKTGESNSVSVDTAPRFTGNPGHSFEKKECLTFVEAQDFWFNALTARERAWSFFLPTTTSDVPYVILYRRESIMTLTVPAPRQ
ncbi:MAG TPA: hypothetical protein VF787_26590 [Thermoanaerobaculia bacterium]